MRQKGLAGILAVLFIVGTCGCATGSEKKDENNLSIVLSTNAVEVSVEESVEITYVLMPENSEKQTVEWKSTDETIAIVDDSGVVTGVAVGETNIIASCGDDVFATCAVTVKEKSAYERLDDKEQELVDALLANINVFYDPSSVSIVYAYLSASGTWNITVRAHNQMGGYSEQDYDLKPDGTIEEPIFDHVEMPGNEDYNYDLINQAIAEYTQGA